MESQDRMPTGDSPEIELGASARGASWSNSVSQ